MSIFFIFYLDKMGIWNFYQNNRYVHGGLAYNIIHLISSFGLILYTASERKRRRRQLMSRNVRHGRFSQERDSSSSSLVDTVLCVGAYVARGVNCSRLWALDRVKTRATPRKRDKPREREKGKEIYTYHLYACFEHPPRTDRPEIILY